MTLLARGAQNGNINGQIVGSLGLIGFWLTAIRNPQYGQNVALSQLLSLVVHKRDVKWPNDLWDGQWIGQ